jgi:hypothetical protein
MDRSERYSTWAFGNSNTEMEEKTKESQQENKKEKETIKFSVLRMG